MYKKWGAAVLVYGNSPDSQIIFDARKKFLCVYFYPKYINPKEKKKVKVQFFSPHKDASDIFCPPSCHVQKCWYPQGSKIQFILSK